MTRPDVYLISTPATASIGITESQHASYRVLVKSGATNIEWRCSSSSSNAGTTNTWLARCDDSALCILALLGCTIVSNKTQEARANVSVKLHHAFNSVEFSEFERQEVDIVQMARQIWEHEISPRFAKGHR